jgi:hypothetical protein
MLSRAGDRLAAALTAVLVMAATGARAAEDDPAKDKPAGKSAESASAGAFLPWTMGARSDTQRALVYGQGGYDSGGKGAVFQTVIEAQVFGRVSLRAGGSYGGTGERFRPEAGLRVDALRQNQHGVDLALLGVYEGESFNMVRAITARVAISRSLGDTRLVTNLGYGVGLDQDERHGDLRLAGLQRLSPNLHLGLDSRLRVDLERDDDEPAGEPDWELVAGPLATYSLGRFVVSASAGVSALKLRLVEKRQVGAIGTLGFGAVF